MSEPFYCWGKSDRAEFEKRVPQNDFMFQLTQEESAALRFQIETSKPGRGGRRYRPHVFTEHGVEMLSSVLNGK